MAAKKGRNKPNKTGSRFETKGHSRLTKAGTTNMNRVLPSLNERKVLESFGRDIGKAAKGAAAAVKKAKNPLDKQRNRTIAKAGGRAASRALARTPLFGAAAMTGFDVGTAFTKTKMGQKVVNKLSRGMSKVANKVKSKKKGKK